MNSVLIFRFLKNSWSNVRVRNAENINMKDYISFHFRDRYILVFFKINITRTIDNTDR